MLGYKGFPILCWHPNFDVVKGMVTDYLHCVMLGVTKALLNSWLDPKNSSFGFYIGKEVSKFSLIAFNIFGSVTLYLIPTA